MKKKTRATPKKTTTKRKPLPAAQKTKTGIRAGQRHINPCV